MSMENRNMPPQSEMRTGKRSLFDQPRKAVSGMMYSGAIIGMLLISLAFAVTLAIIAASLEKTVDELSGTDAYKYMSYLLYQLVYIALILAFMKIYRERPAKFGWRKTHWKYLALALPLAYGLLFSLNWVNGLFVQLLSLIGYKAPPSSLPALSGGGIVGVLIVVALLPAVCEETLFRGIILEGIKDVGTVAACLLGGLLFSVFHQSPSQTVYQFICGCVFTLVALRADSLLPAALMHFLNNAIIVFSERFGFLEGLPAGAQIALYVSSAVCLLASLAYLLFLDKSGNRKKEGEIRPFVYPALPGLLLCIVMWIFSLVNGMAG